MQSQNPITHYSKFWNGDPRPTWDKWNLTIESEWFYPKLSLSGSRGLDRDTSRLRPKRLQALVLPVTTKGRGGAPDPQSGLELTYYPYDRGHLIGLELGGPDVEDNIAPQWANYQRTQTWRKMETAIRKLALGVMGMSSTPAPASWMQVLKAPAHVVQMTVELFYGREPTIPNAFRVTLKKMRMSDGSQVQFGDEAGPNKGALDIVHQMENEPDQRDLNIAGKMDDKMRK